jgi:hypothetical protein
MVTTNIVNFLRDGLEPQTSTAIVLRLIDALDGASILLVGIKEGPILPPYKPNP